jgi:hypothetical protein
VSQHCRQGTSFQDNKDFSKSVGSKGVGAMELVAMDLKARGLFLARSLSYRGAEFQIEYVCVLLCFRSARAAFVASEEGGRGRGGATFNLHVP